jgi:Uma2 family endonuclease
MGAAEQIPRISFDEFLRLEELNASKHEWLNGIVYMMAGGTFEHGRLVDNLLVTLRQRLHGRPCQPYSGNFLVRTPSGLGAYPDVMVFCGAIQGDASDPRRAATNPTVIFEVLSESTEAYDRGEKFESYKSIPSLEAYVLVHQNDRKVEIFSRREGWNCHIASAGQSLEVSAIDVSISIDELY